MSFHKHLLPPLSNRSTSRSNMELRRGSAARDFICDSGRMRFLLLLSLREEQRQRSLLLLCVETTLFNTLKERWGVLLAITSTALRSDCMNTCSTHLVKVGQNAKNLFQTTPKYSTKQHTGCKHRQRTVTLPSTLNASQEGPPFSLQ